MCVLAGPQAELRWTQGRPGCPIDWRQRFELDASTDFALAAQLADRGSLSEPEAQAWLRYIEERTRSWLGTAETWHIIEVVAQKLLDQKEVSWHDVDAIAMLGEGA